MRLSDFAERAVRRVAARDPARVVPKMERPRAPITAGAAGVALFLEELARAADGASRVRMANRARLWVTVAERMCRNPRSAFGFPGHSFEGSFGGLGVFHGRAGVYTVAARVASVRGEIKELHRAASGFVKTWRTACAGEHFPTEAFFGFAGFMHAARDFQAHSTILGPELDQAVRSVGNESHALVCKSFARLARRPLPKQLMLGYAHGLVGEIDAALAWNPQPSAVVAAVLDQLLAQAVVEDELAAWPARVGDEVGGPIWASWCNGMAGHVYLWCRAYEAFRDERYLTAARLSAQTTAVLCPSTPIVCCGTAGQAFALDRYYRLTGEPKYRRLAVARTRRACAQATANRLSKLTYFGGLAGIGHLAFMMSERRTPRFPLID